MPSLVIATTGTISGVAENTQINAMAASLATAQQASTAPTATSTGLSSIAGLWWHDLSTGIIKVRDQADTAWINLGTINETAKTFAPAGSSGSYLVLSGGTLTGGLVVQAGGVSITAGGLSVAAGGASITGNTSITGNLSASGTITFSGTSAASFGGGISAAGQINSTSGGFKFPDGSVQTSAFSGAGYALTSALASYAPLASPALTGTPTAPTQAIADSSTTLATTAFVHAAILAALTSYASSGTPSGGTG